MAGLIYGLCALTAFVCAWLLLQAYGRNRYRLLLWGGLCFCGLTISNVLLVVDKVFAAEVELYTPRLLIALSAMVVLLYGLIWESE